MAYTIKIIHNGKATDVTKTVSSVEWNDSTDQLGAEINLTIPYSRFDDNFSKVWACGDKVAIYSSGKEVIRGVITDTPINGDSYKAYDYAFYLNKSETIIQFNGIAADKAIRQLCARYSVPIGSMPSMTASIKCVYKDKVVSDIILDILKKVRSESGTRYHMEMVKGKLCIVKGGATQIKPTYTDALGNKVSCAATAEISGTKSITEMRNQVIYAGSDEKKTDVKAIAKSSASISKYGLLSQVETEDKLTSAKARNKAKNMLKELNKVAVSFTADMVGNTSVRSNRMIYFSRPEMGIKGWYKVKSCTHTIANGIHMMSCEMERV